jgi:dUTP pyrophosphatase
MKIKVKKFDPEAKLPSYAHEGDVGLDLFALETITIKPGERVKVRTGIAMELALGYGWFIWDKSGVANNYGLKTLGGLIDAGYRGEFLIGLINLSREPYTVEKHHKVAQVVIQKVEIGELIEVDELTDSSRGAGGFGSTGK